jgi:hypothetical protein
MTTKALDNGGAVAVRKSARLPALQEAEAEAKAFKAFNKFVETLDELVEYHERLEEIAHELDVAHLAGKPDEIPSADRFKRDKAWLRDDLDRCREGFRRFDQDGDDDARYDEEGSITFQHASVRLGMLVGSYANAKPGSPEVFGKMLVLHVLAVEPMVCELESACRALVLREKPFAPETTEIVAAVRSEKPKWLKRRHAFKQVDELRRKIIAAIPRAKAIAEEAVKEKAAQKWVEAKERAEYVVARQHELNEKAQVAGFSACRYAHMFGLRRTLYEECGRHHHRDEELVSFVLGCYQRVRMKGRQTMLFAAECAMYALERGDAKAARSQLEAFGAALAARADAATPRPFGGYWTAQITTKIWEAE